jgi:hypothetical protein
VGELGEYGENWREQSGVAGKWASGIGLALPRAVGAPDMIPPRLLDSLSRRQAFRTAGMAEFLVLSLNNTPAVFYKAFWSRRWRCSQWEDDGTHRLNPDLISVCHKIDSKDFINLKTLHLNL